MVSAEKYFKTYTAVTKIRMKELMQMFELKNKAKTSAEKLAYIGESHFFRPRAGSQESKTLRYRILHLYKSAELLTAYLNDHRGSVIEMKKYGLDLDEDTNAVAQSLAYVSKWTKDVESSLLEQYKLLKDNDLRGYTREYENEQRLFVGLKDFARTHTSQIRGIPQKVNTFIIAQRWNRKDELGTKWTREIPIGLCIVTIGVFFLMDVLLTGAAKWDLGILLAVGAAALSLMRFLAQTKQEEAVCQVIRKLSQKEMDLS